MPKKIFLFYIFCLCVSQFSANAAKRNANGNVNQQLPAAFACEQSLPELDEEVFYKGKEDYRFSLVKV